MTNALLAARERGETGRKLPEGRQILPLGAGSVNGPRGSGREEVAQNGRGASLAPSGQSSEFSMGSAGHSQANGKPRRGPAPPNPPGLRRSTSNFSDRASQDPPATSTSTSGATAAGRGTPKQKSVGRKLGELVRKVALLVYWCVVGPITLLREMGWRSAWKWAAAIALLGLMLGECRGSMATLLPAWAEARHHRCDRLDERARHIVFGKSKAASAMVLFHPTFLVVRIHTAYRPCTTYGPSQHRRAGVTPHKPRDNLCDPIPSTGVRSRFSG